MRTTLDIDDDVLAAVKELAAVQGLTAGRLASDLLRRSLTAPAPDKGGRSVPAGFAEEQQAMFIADGPMVKSGWVVLPRRGGLVTNELVAKLEDELDQEDSHSALAARREHAGRPE